MESKKYGEQRGARALRLFCMPETLKSLEERLMEEELVIGTPTQNVKIPCKMSGITKTPPRPHIPEAEGEEET